MSAPPHFDEARIAELCDLATVTDWLEQAWTDLGNDAAATTVRVRANADGLMASAMAASWPRHNVAGGKLYLTHPNGFEFLVALFSPDGGLLATFDGLGLTAIRTAAGTALAMRYLKPPDAQVCALFGTGTQSRPHIQAMVQELDVTDLRICGRSPDKVDSLVAWANDQGVPARATSASEAVEGANVVAAVTASYEPLFDGTLLEPEAMVCGVGSTKAERRELDRATVERAAFIVTDEPRSAPNEAGDLVHAVADGVFDWDDLVDLKDVVVGNVAPPKAGTGIVLFESQGVALQDVAIATLAHQRSQG